jgi:hypothetical protein
MNACYEDLHQDLDRLNDFIMSLEGRLPRPFEIIDERSVRGFRYAKPGLLHYIALNLANSTKTIRSIIFLLETGFNLQACILMRFVMEANSKLGYVLHGVNEQEIDRKSQKFIEEYFADCILDNSLRKKYQPTSQKDIHRRNSEATTRDLESLRKVGLGNNVDNSDNQYAKLQSSLYSIFSNHVHGRYPESMQIYGEFSRALKLNGNVESKDIDESLECEFVGQLIDMTRKNLKLAFMKLQVAKLVSLNESERRFAVEGVFT